MRGTDGTTEEWDPMVAGGLPARGWARVGREGDRETLPGRPAQTTQIISDDSGAGRGGVSPNSIAYNRATDPRRPTPTLLIVPRRSIPIKSFSRQATRQVVDRKGTGPERRVVLSQTQSLRVVDRGGVAADRVLRVCARRSVVRTRST